MAGEQVGRDALIVDLPSDAGRAEPVASYYVDDRLNKLLRAYNPHGEFISAMRKPSGQIKAYLDLHSSRCESGQQDIPTIPDTWGTHRYLLVHGGSGRPNFEPPAASFRFPID